MEKKRGLIECEDEVDEKKLIEIIKKTSQYDTYIKNKDILRVIFVKNKIINLIVK